MRRAPALIAFFALLLVATPPSAQQTAAPRGKAAYDKWCAGCHGVDGRGEGPAAGTMLPRPRDFTTAMYQIRSTPSGAMPTDDDLMRIIDHGMPGTAMPGWRDNLGKQARADILAYIKSFSPMFESAAPEIVDIGKAPGVSDEGLAEGREFYEKIECWKCHGQAGRGDGQSAPTLEDDQDHPVRAADLTENWHFNGGGEAEDIMRRLMTGMYGTPMPSFADLIDAGFMTREQLWRVAQYVRSLSPGKPPVAREVVRAGRVEGELPSTVGDPAWDGVERYYIPLVGQIIVKPRWFAPSVDGVWVQALHDDREIALRLTWSDPSQSPDPRWSEWTAKVRATMAPELGEAAPADTAAGPVPAPAAVPADTNAPAAADTTAPAPAPAGAAGLPDALAIQFPTTIPAGMERPYFLMGSDREPVYLLSWTSTEGLEERLGRGFVRTEAFAGAAAPAAADTFDQGQWRLVVRRAFDAGGVEHRLAFEVGRPIPMAVFAWDGSNGESGAEGAVSTWYFLYLDRPASPKVVVAPIVATILMAALGILVVARAQRRARGVI